MQPLSLRNETQPGYEKAAWQPTWKCFCCHDNGIIPERIVKLEMPNYVAGRHKPVKCNNCDIRLGDTLYDTNTLDTRFTAQICERLDRNEREMWKDWSQQQHQKRLEKLALINNPDLTNNLRTRTRLNHEQLEAQRKHQNITNK